MVIAGLTILVQFAILSADPKTAFVAKVNGIAISKSDLDFAAMQDGISDDNRDDADAKLTEQLIDRQLIRTFLSSRKIEPIADELQLQIAQAEELIRKRGEDPQKILAKLGYTPERLKKELGLPIAWRVYANQTITQQQIKDYFERHRQEFDGTQLRGSQIFLKLPKSPDEAVVASKKQKLAGLREDIVAKKLTFADAATEHSEAPTRKQAGDVGLFGWRGKLPTSVSQAAFALKVNEISEPIQSPFGLHLIQVTERHPGDFSLEDVRPVITEQLSQDLWASTVAKERTSAKIERASVK